MQKILVPLDGSERSESILPHVEILVQRTSVKVVLLRVVPFLWPNEFVQAKEIADKMDKEVSDYLFALHAQLGEKGIAGEFCVFNGNVPEIICDLASEKGVDLIAMSTHGRGGLKRWALGSVADKVVQTSPVPVFLSRGVTERVVCTPYKNILIPVDGSQFAENIFFHVRELVELFGAKVWFLHVINTHPIESFTVLHTLVEKEEIFRKSVQDYFSTLEKKLKEVQATSYELCSRRGNPAETICDFAAENNIDLVAMSTHGRGGITRWALGSVTDKVIQGSSKPVFLIRAQE